MSTILIRMAQHFHAGWTRTSCLLSFSLSFNPGTKFLYLFIFYLLRCQDLNEKKKRDRKGQRMICAHHFSGQSFWLLRASSSFSVSFSSLHFFFPYSGSWTGTHSKRIKEINRLCASHRSGREKRKEEKGILWFLWPLQWNWNPSDAAITTK